MALADNMAVNKNKNTDRVVNRKTSEKTPKNSRWDNLTVVPQKLGFFFHVTKSNG